MDKEKIHLGSEFMTDIADAIKNSKNTLKCFKLFVFVIFSSVTRLQTKTSNLKQLYQIGSIVS